MSMKKYFHKNKEIIYFVLSLVIIWRILISICLFFGSTLLPLRHTFTAVTLLGNFDGFHYMSIAQNGYSDYEQAFFPLYPLLIKYLAIITFNNYVWAAMIITYTALCVWLFILYTLVRLDFSPKVSKWTLVFILFSPVGFFFGAVYTESLFLMLVLASFLFARKKMWLAAGLFVGLASATKFVGIFVLPALIVEWYMVYRGKNLHTHIYRFVGMVILGCTGLISYCFYLWKVYGDAILFVHAQPAFGANRTGGELIFLPQVIYRYIKIFLTVSFSHYDTWIALLEFSLLGISLFLLFYGYFKQKMRASYILFSLLTILGPTLTGTLSSVPRYILVAFPVFIALGLIKNTKYKIIILCISLLIFVISCTFYLRGYFIA